MATVKNNMSDQDMVFTCIKSGLKAIDIAGYLNVNPSTITKIQSKKIRSFKPKLHNRLVLLCEFLQATQEKSIL